MRDPKGRRQSRSPRPEQCVIIGKDSGELQAGGRKARYIYSVSHCKKFFKEMSRLNTVITQQCVFRELKNFSFFSALHLPSLSLAEIVPQGCIRNSRSDVPGSKDLYRIVPHICAEFFGRRRGRHRVSNLHTGTVD